MDPDTTPYLDIANQTGRSIEIPPQAKKVGKIYLPEVIKRLMKQGLRSCFKYSIEIQLGFLGMHIGSTRYLLQKNNFEIELK